MPNEARVPIHGEIIGDISTATKATVYKASAPTTAYTVAAADRVVITDITLSASADATIQFYQDADDDNTVDGGETIEAGYFLAGGGVAKDYVTAYWCTAGITPEAVSSTADTVRIIFNGFLVTGA